MKFGRKIHLPLMAVCLVFLSGCATTSMGVAADKQTTVQKEAIDYSVGDPVEAAILSVISTMKSGEKGTAGAVAYVVGNAYAAASGVLCKPVTIIGDSSAGARLACMHGQRWSFSNEVFLAGSDRD